MVMRIVVPRKRKTDIGPPPPPFHEHDNDVNVIRALKLVHEELQHGLKAYMSNGLRKVISAIHLRCQGDVELLTLCPSTVELKCQWYRAYNKYFQVSFRRLARTYS